MWFFYTCSKEHGRVLRRSVFTLRVRDLDPVVTDEILDGHWTLSDMRSLVGISGTTGCRSSVVPYITCKCVSKFIWERQVSRFSTCPLSTVQAQFERSHLHDSIVCMGVAM